ncbi:MAG: ABC transporter substrate-binding protein [Phycisphaerales bacterium]|nr:ABC transporter substrate-binding protein [Phycisphaerales bacterium]
MRTLITMLALALLAACSGLDGRVQEQSGGPRLASLSPALTAMVVELGSGDRIIGRSQFCTDVDASVPIVGDLLNVNWEQLARVRPTHILIQSAPQSLDPAMVELADRRGWTLVVFPLVTAADIQHAMATLPGALDLDDVEAGFAKKRSDSFQKRIDEHLADAPVIDGERVLLVSAMEPPLAWGRNTYLGQLAERLGAENALNADGWIPIGYEEVVRCETDRVIIVGAAEPDPDHPIFSATGRMNVRVDVLVDQGLLLPATRLPDITRSLREVLVARGDS